MKRTIKRSGVLFSPEAIGWFIAGVLCAAVIWHNGPGTTVANTIAILLPLVTFIIIVPTKYIPAYLKLRRIEKTLGLDFNEEMARLGVTKFCYQDYKWYISSRTVIMHRDFVNGIGVVEELSWDDGDGAWSIDYRIPIIGCDGRQMNLYDKDKHDFKDWLTKYHSRQK